MSREKVGALKEDLRRLREVALAYTQPGGVSRSGDAVSVLKSGSQLFSLSLRFPPYDLPPPQSAMSIKRAPLVMQPPRRRIESGRRNCSAALVNCGNDGGVLAKTTIDASVALKKQ